MYYYICCLSGGQKKPVESAKTLLGEKQKKQQEIWVGTKINEPAPGLSLMYKTILSRLKFGANTEDRVTSSGYQLLYILLTSLDRPLGNTTMNRNECTFLLTAFRWKVLIYSIAIIIIITIIIIIMAS